MHLKRITNFVCSSDTLGSPGFNLHGWRIRGEIEMATSLTLPPSCGASARTVINGYLSGEVLAWLNWLFFLSAPLFNMHINTEEENAYNMTDCSRWKLNLALFLVYFLGYTSVKKLEGGAFKILLDFHKLPIPYSGVLKSYKCCLLICSLSSIQWLLELLGYVFLAYLKGVVYLCFPQHLAQDLVDVRWLAVMLVDRSELVQPNRWEHQGSSDLPESSDGRVRTWTHIFQYSIP